MKNSPLLILFFSLAYFWASSQQLCKNATHILSQSVNHHDPDSSWSSVNFKIHIEEPRIEELDRYSVVSINQRTGAFSIDRNRAGHISTHLIDSSGQARILWDGKPEIPQEYIDLYRLDAKTNYGFKRFYQLMYGLPMSLKKEPMELNYLATAATFQSIPAYVIEMELQRPMISKNWRIFIAQDDYRLLGVDLYSKADSTRGERIVLSDLIEIQTLLIPRIRHWYTFEKEYLGTDIIMNTLD